MNRREAEQTLGMVNEYHFKANPEPVTEEWLAYCREERDTRIKLLNNAGYAVDLQHSDSLEHCGHYVLGEQKYPILQEDGIRSLCPTCGKLHHYQMPNVDTLDSYAKKFIEAMHQHLDFCRCSASAHPPAPTSSPSCPVCGKMRSNAWLERNAATSRPAPAVNFYSLDVCHAQGECAPKECPDCKWMIPAGQPHDCAHLKSIMRS